MPAGVTGTRLPSASPTPSQSVTARRAIGVTIAVESRTAQIEDAGRLRDALGVPLPIGVPAAFIEPVDDPVGDLVSRYARTHGPFTVTDAASRFGLGVAVVTDTLRRLAADRRVVDGEFRPGATETPTRSGPGPLAAATSGRRTEYSPGVRSGMTRLPLASEYGGRPRKARCCMSSAGWMTVPPS